MYRPVKVGDRIRILKNSGWNPAWFGVIEITNRFNITMIRPDKVDTPIVSGFRSDLYGTLQDNFPEKQYKRNWEFAEVKERREPKWL